MLIKEIRQALLIKEIRQGIVLRDPIFVGFASVKIYRVLFFWLG